MIKVVSKKDVPFGVFSINSIDLDSSSSVLSQMIGPPLNKNTQSRSIIYKTVNKKTVKPTIVNALKKAIYFKSKSNPDFDRELLNTGLMFINVKDPDIPEQICLVYSALLVEYREFLFYKYKDDTLLFAKTMYYMFNVLNKNIEVYIEDLYQGKTMMEIVEECEKTYEFDIQNINIEEESMLFATLNPEYIIKVILLQTEYYKTVMQYENSTVLSMEVDMFVTVDANSSLALQNKKNFFVYQKSYESILSYLISRLNFRFFESKDLSLNRKITTKDLFEFYDSFINVEIQDKLIELLEEKYEKNQYLFEILYACTNKTILVSDFEPENIVSEFTNKKKEISEGRLVFVTRERVLDSFHTDSFFRFYIQTFISELMDFARVYFVQQSPQTLLFCSEHFTQITFLTVKNDHVSCDEDVLLSIEKIYRLDRETSQTAWNLACSTILAYYDNTPNYTFVKTQMVKDMYKYSQKNPSFHNIKRVYEYCVQLLFETSQKITCKTVYSVFPLLNNASFEKLLFFEDKQLNTSSEAILLCTKKINELFMSRQKNTFRINKILAIMNV